ncbi:hypothetical protein [Lacrimispora algidixylanolytica]|uniref:Uncharacterized protein n=1 Tax=Lacrimispora algidixylanolytica TaxID=94868 RepID=A0A419T2F8_9FIRM|nr:hypothetical protein [Lacrimispora algidixylanolytica]RKD31744.1 hypothetical protein BET01_19685 [Lacrimispora algidixylanolytica]
MINFNNVDIPISAILESINCDDNVISVIAYWSQMDGLGNKHSDIDLYVLTHSNTNVKCQWDYGITKISCPYINGVKFDIEYWEYDKVMQIIADIHNKSLVLIEDRVKLTVLSRIYKGICIFGKTIKEQINYEELRNYIIYLYRWSCKSSYDDAKHFADVSDYTGTLTSNSFAVMAGMTAINACNSKLILQPKWVPKVYMETEANDLVTQYIDGFVFVNVTEQHLPFLVDNQLKIIKRMLLRLE